MINFLIVLFIVFIKQIIFFTTFCLTISINIDGIGFIMFVFLILFLISHFLHSKKLYEKLKLNKNTYNLYGFISWILVSCLIFCMMNIDWFWDLLPRTGGWFDGLPYAFVPIFLVGYLIILGILKLIILIICKLTKKIK